MVSYNITTPPEFSYQNVQGSLHGSLEQKTDLEKTINNLFDFPISDASALSQRIQQLSLHKINLEEINEQSKARYFPIWRRVINAVSDFASFFATVSSPIFSLKASDPVLELQNTFACEFYAKIMEREKKRLNEPLESLLLEKKWPEESKTLQVGNDFSSKKDLLPFEETFEPAKIVALQKENDRMSGEVACLEREAAALQREVHDLAEKCGLINRSLAELCREIENVKNSIQEKKAIKNSYETFQKEFKRDLNDIEKIIAARDAESSPSDLFHYMESQVAEKRWALVALQEERAKLLAALDQMAHNAGIREKIFRMEVPSNITSECENSFASEATSTCHYLEFYRDKRCASDVFRTAFERAYQQIREAGLNRIYDMMPVSIQSHPPDEAILVICRLAILELLLIGKIVTHCDGVRIEINDYVEMKSSSRHEVLSFIQTEQKNWQLSFLFECDDRDDFTPDFSEIEELSQGVNPLSAKLSLENCSKEEQEMLRMKFLLPLMPEEDPRRLVGAQACQEEKIEKSAKYIEECAYAAFINFKNSIIFPFLENNLKQGGKVEF